VGVIVGAAALLGCAGGHAVVTADPDPASAPLPAPQASQTAAASTAPSTPPRLFVAVDKPCPGMDVARIAGST
jgi:hypothetical protein